MDIFKKTLWYTYKENRAKWFKLSLEQVLEIIDLNKKNEVAIPLEEYESEIEELVTVDFENVVGQDSLTRFDVPKKSRRRNRKNKNRNKAAVGAKSSHSKRQQKPKNSNQSNTKSPNAQKRNNNQNKPQNKRRKPKSNGNSNQK